MKKKDVLLTAMALMAGGAAVTSKKGKKLLKKMKKKAKQFIEEVAAETARKQQEEPVYDPLAGLSDEARTLMQAVWNLVRDELEDDMTIADVRFFMETNCMVDAMLERLKYENGGINTDRHALILAAYDCVAADMTDEERLDVLLTTIDRMYEEQNQSHPFERDYDDPEDDEDNEEAYWDGEA